MWVLSKPLRYAVMHLVAQSCLTLSDPWTVASQAPLSMGFSRQEYWSGLPFLTPGDLSKPGIKPRSPTLQADSLPSEPPRKPKNTGVGSLSLLQGTFSTQEWNRCFLHYRWILYQLSYQGSLSFPKLLLIPTQVFLLSILHPRIMMLFPIQIIFFFKK